jgi:hypothetical protein
MQKTQWLIPSEMQLSLRLPPDLGSRLCAGPFSTGSPTHLLALTSGRTKAQNTIPSGRLSSNPQFVELFRMRPIERS